MEKLLIVDGSNLLFQMFYGMPARIVNGAGRPVQGTLGFLGALLKSVRALQPTHLLVTFDGERGSDRTDLDEAYKANRPDYTGQDELELPFGQMPDICAALEALGVCCRETDGCEADDWIAGYAALCGGDRQAVILSQDSDFYQLVSPAVSVYRYRGGSSTLVDPGWIREKLGVEPGQYADFKSLTGDSADNIRGAHKVGPKTAAKLLRQFGTLEGVLAQIGQIPQPSIRAALEGEEDRLRRNYALIKLSGGCQLPFPWEALRWTDPGCTSTELLKKLEILP